MKNKIITGIIFLVVCCFCFAMLAKISPATDAAKLTEKECLAWLEKNKDAKPQFKVGDVITWDKKAMIEPFDVLPGQYLHLYDGMKIPIKGLPDTNDYTPHDCYKEATKKFYGQPKLDDKGILLNFKAGKPFPEELMKNDDPKTKGLKMGYNFQWRWHHMDNSEWNRPVYKAIPGGALGRDLGVFWFIRPGVTKTTFGFPKAWIQGGDVQRCLLWYYKQTWYTGRADLPQHDYKVDSPDAGAVMWKEIMPFIDPYDVKGSTTLTIRYVDEFKPDDGWVYVPAARRVRRMATGQRADSLLGSEFTMDDFFGHSGRILSWDWTYLGEKAILAWPNAIQAEDEGIFGGPTGGANLNSCSEIRNTYVVEMKAKYQHPYSKKVIFFDQDNYAPHFFYCFDQAGKLWKTYTITSNWADNPMFKGTPAYGKRSMQCGNGHAGIYNHQTDVAAAGVGFTLTWDPPKTGKELDEFYSQETLRQWGK